MIRRKPKDVWEFGDFQTPPELARRICALLTRLGVRPDCVLEPTCGRGAFVTAAAREFPEAHRIVGVDINAAHIEQARCQIGDQLAASRVELSVGDFFKIDWQSLIGSGQDRLLVLGNTPWVTSAELSSLMSDNTPTKSNFRGLSGIDAMTGKSNFDISEWMLLRSMGWLEDRVGWIAVLLKTTVARKLIAHAWKRRYPLRRVAMYRVDAAASFGASVDACLFVAEVGPGPTTADCPVFSTLEDVTPSQMIGFQDDMLVADVQGYCSTRHLLGPELRYIWRSGIKHDCSKVMELAVCPAGYRNGTGEVAALEGDYVFPMLKSSDVHNGQRAGERFMIVPQRTTGDDTASVQTVAPLTWSYLERHTPALAARTSSIYRGRPPFSIFGVGEYSFAPWKVAISGFYKALRFTVVAPHACKPVVFDDTVYFLPCQSEAEAAFLIDLLASRPAQTFYSSLIFWADKRPITGDLLRRLSLAKVASEVNRSDDYERYAPATPPRARRSTAPRAKAPAAGLLAGGHAFPL